LAFAGRLNRTQYALLFVIGYIGPLALFFILESQMHDADASFAFAPYLLPFFLLWVLLALLAKRFHDIDKPGICCLFVFVPLVGMVTLIVMFFVPGTAEANQYGPPS
jgi:uncharacterized membrane protein YhaH (DUF805 family)